DARDACGLLVGLGAGRLAAGDEDAHVRLEPMAGPIELERAAARDDIEDLLPVVELPRVGAAGGMARDPLLEQLAAVAGVERGANLGAAFPPRLDFVRVDD